MRRYVSLIIILLTCICSSDAYTNRPSRELDSLYDKAYDSYTTPKGIIIINKLYDKATQEGNLKLQSKSKLIAAKYYAHFLSSNQFEKKVIPLKAWLREHQSYQDYYHVCIYQINKLIIENKYIDANHQINEMYVQAQKDHCQYGIEGSYRMRGYLHKARFAYIEALKCFQKEYQLEKQHNSPVLYSALYNIGVCYMLTGQHSLALKYCNVGRRLTKEPSALVGFDLLEGHIFFNFLDYAKADYFYNRVVTYTQKTTMDYALSDIWIALQMAHYMIHKDYSSVEHLLSKMPVKRRVQLLPQYYQMRGDYKQAYVAQKKLALYTDSLYGTLATVDLQQFEQIIKDNRLHEEMQQLELDNKNQSIFITLCIVVVVIAVLSLVISLLVRRNRDNKRNAELQAEQANLLRQQTELLKQQAEMLTNERDAQNNFIQDMSHEIRTPLHQLNGFADVLLTGTGSMKLDAESLKSVVDGISASSEQLTLVLNTMLRLYNLQVGASDCATENVDAMEICLMAASGTSEQHPHLHPTVPDECLISYQFSTKRIYLQDLMEILVNNALKFTGEGSITVGYQKKDNELSFYVEDTGKGIPDDQAELIFDRFYKIDRFVPGIGLGLTVAKELAKKLNAHLYLDSTYTDGARFVLDIPFEC